MVWVLVLKPLVKFYHYRAPVPKMILLQDSIQNQQYNVTGALIWYCPVTTIRTADTSILTSRVLPNNYYNTSATKDIIDTVLIMISNVCSIIINESSIIVTGATLFLSRGIPARRTIYY